MSMWLERNASGHQAFPESTSPRRIVSLSCAEALCNAAPFGRYSVAFRDLIQEVEAEESDGALDAFDMDS